ncbi:VanZ family protein [Spirilliplanes yamanashiensis]|uniref:VanZ-like domain-containing protein n=1 Tax=Spirilliplanes yamanashiensis TaxID=42233 RepID=A0A8J4DIS3_9ACTN|nr:VanZ family protein [Spirilliplanes yamanashiensis]MDP9814984.1 glycopeptide antibiotics resistance protein [Spirilliplanes yamanashiensis]GIJ02639.1 hypothetical protein Sya03_19910 [Spirilliplanes yamanashiensis]
MSAAWRDHGATIVAALIVLPVGGVVAYLLLVGRLGRRRAAAVVGLVAGTVPFLVMLFTPQPAPRSLALRPLRDVPSWFDGSWLTAAEQVGGNLLALAAVGAFLPVLWRPVATLPRIVLLAAVASAGIEAAQWVADVGRVSSVDDVLVNTLGAALAALATRPWWTDRKRDHETALISVA